MKINNPYKINKQKAKEKLWLEEWDQLSKLIENNIEVDKLYKKIFE